MTESGVERSPQSNEIEALQLEPGSVKDREVTSPTSNNEQSSDSNSDMANGGAEKPDQFLSRPGHQLSPVSDKSLEGSTSMSDKEKPEVKRRKSVQQLITGFNQLRSCLGVYPPDRHLSRIETLRMAITYIGDLQAILLEDSICHSTMYNSPQRDISAGSLYSGRQARIGEGNFFSPGVIPMNSICDLQMGPDIYINAGYSVNPSNTAGDLFATSRSRYGQLPENKLEPASKIPVCPSATKLPCFATSSSSVLSLSPDDLLGSASSLNSIGQSINSSTTADVRQQACTASPYVGQDLSTWLMPQQRNLLPTRRSPTGDCTTGLRMLVAQPVNESGQLHSLTALLDIPGATVDRRVCGGTSPQTVMGRCAPPHALSSWSHTATGDALAETASILAQNMTRVPSSGDMFTDIEAMVSRHTS